MRISDLYERERPKWSGRVLVLWVLAGVSERSVRGHSVGGGGSANILPSAD